MNVIEEFNNKGFVVVKDMINTKPYYVFAKSIKKEGIVDDQSKNAGSFYNKKKMDELHSKLLNKMEKITRLQLFKTYTYFRIYYKGAMLAPHIDRAACEISVSLNIGGNDWALGCFDYEHNPTHVLLKPGDGLVYHGCDLIHWRPGKFKGKKLVQCFLHYVNQNGSRAWTKDDLVR